MMKLTAVQEDALIELLNIGFGRAAASLSQLTGHRVLLEVPHVGAARRDRERRTAVGEPVELEGAGDETEGHRLGGRIVLNEAGIRCGGFRRSRRHEPWPNRPSP